MTRAESRGEARVLQVLTVLNCLAGLVACGSTSAGNNENHAGVAAPRVGYLVLQPVSVPLVVELGGRVSASRSSEVRPQVTGVIRRRFFTEGALVTEGETLYQIDPSLYRAAAHEARANLESAKATEEAAHALAERYRPLVDMAAISKQDYTNALAASHHAAAAVDQARAELETSEINLRFTTVPAPISGRIGRSLVTVGALVAANQPESLAQIQDLDPAFVDIQQSSTRLLALRHALGQGGMAPATAEVRLDLEDGTEYPNKGTLQFSEVLVNPATGTVTLRARFDNPGGVLLPGMFVRARFTQGLYAKAFLIPQIAVSRDVGGNAFVYVVSPGDRAERRQISVDRAQAEFWVATEGVVAGDRVIVEGLAKLKSDALVNPVPARAAGVASSSVGERSVGSSGIHRS